MIAKESPNPGRLVSESHHLPVRIYYEDTDFSGVAYHASYLRFFERGRTEFIRALGIDQRALFQEDGIAFAVRSLSIEYLKPARMDDVVDVITTVAELRGPTLRLEQTLLRGEEILTTASVLVVCIREGRLCRLPASLKAAMQRAGAG